MNNDDQYHLALGRFIDAFATAEHNLKFAMANVANVPRETAQAIFSGTRVKTAIDFIRRIFASRNESIPEDIDKSLSQMSAILNARDEIVHYGGHFDGTTLVTSNAPHTIPRQAKTKHRSLDELEAMTSDLLTLGKMFIWIVIKDNPNSFQEAIDLLCQSGHAPFRYKPK